MLYKAFTIERNSFGAMLWNKNLWVDIKIAREESSAKQSIPKGTQYQTINIYAHTQKSVKFSVYLRDSLLFLLQWTETDLGGIWGKNK